MLPTDIHTKGTWVVQMPHITTANHATAITITVPQFAEAHATAIARQMNWVKPSPLDAHKLNTNPLDTHKL